MQSQPVRALRGPGQWRSETCHTASRIDLMEGALFHEALLVVVATSFLHRQSPGARWSWHETRLLPGFTRPLPCEDSRYQVEMKPCMRCVRKNDVSGLCRQCSIKNMYQQPSSCVSKYVSPP